MSRSPLPASGSRIGLISITVAGMLWGTTGIVVHLVGRSTGLDPVGIGFYRLAIAAAVLLGCAVPRLQVLLTAVRSAPLLLGMRRATCWGVGTAVIGLAVITGSPATVTASATRPRLGLAMAVGSGLGYAVTTVLSRAVAGRVPPMAMTTASTAVGGLVLAPVAVLAGELAVPARLGSGALLGYLGVVTTAVAYGLFNAGLRTTAGSTATVLTLTEPLTAAVLAVLILDDSLSLTVLAGGALLMSAVLIPYLCSEAGPREER